MSHESQVGGRIQGAVRALRERLEQPEPPLAAVCRDLARLERTVGMLERVAVESFDEFEERVRDLSLLRRFTDVVVSKFDLTELCRALAEIALDEISSCASLVFLTAAGDAEPFVALGRVDDPAVGELAYRAARRALAELRPLDIADAEEDAELEALAREAHVRSLLVHPIATLGQPLGVLLLLDASPGKFGPDDGRALAGVADLAGIAMRHLQLSREVVARKELESALREPDRALHQVRLAFLRRDKLFALTRLAASVGHEINNPMSYVLSNVGRAGEYVDELEGVVAKLAGGRVPGDVESLVADFRELLADVEDGLERTRRIAQGLHSMGRNSDEPTGECDVNEIVERAVEMARTECMPSVRFAVSPRPLPPIPCRRFQIAQAVFNLLVNAAEAAGPGGTVRVSTGQAGRKIHIEVADDGPGIPPERREIIFEPFYSTKREGGTGLGLAIARDIAESHRGVIDVSAREGAVFTLELPAFAVDAA